MEVWLAFSLQLNQPGPVTSAWLRGAKVYAQLHVGTTLPYYIKPPIILTAHVKGY